MKLLSAVLFLVATLLIYLGVPLLGWGLSNLGSFFATAPRLGYAAAVGLFSMAVGFQAYGSTKGIRGGRGQEGKFVFRQRVVRIALVLSLYIALFFIPFFDRHAIGVFNVLGLIQWLGVALSALGYGLIFLSGVALGRQYSADVTIQKDHQLITTGIYRLIRNPRYLGIIALAIGMPFVFRSWVGLIACLIFTAVLLFRIKDEEILMRKEFGGEWDAYCNHSWRLIPYVY